MHNVLSLLILFLKGPQCEKCQPLFVGDPSNSGQCVPCIEYCNGHTSICINDSLPAPPVRIGGFRLLQVP